MPSPLAARQCCQHGRPSPVVVGHRCGLTVSVGLVVPFDTIPSADRTVRLPVFARWWHVRLLRRVLTWFRLWQLKRPATKEPFLDVLTEILTELHRRPVRVLSVQALHVLDRLPLV